jgi:hypothetical protein
MLTHVRPARSGLPPVSSSFKGRVFPSTKSGTHPEPPSAQSPFARLGGYLQRRGVWRLVSGHCSAFNTTTNSCVRPSPSARLVVILVQAIFAGCRQSLLEIGPSRRYLRSLCQGAWTLTPQRSLDISACVPAGAPEETGTKDIGLAQGRPGSARQTLPAMQLQQGVVFRGGSHSLMFRLPDSLGPQIAPTTARRCIRTAPPSSRAVYLTQ